MVDEPWQYTPQVPKQLRVLVVVPMPHVVLQALGELQPPQ